MSATFEARQEWRERLEDNGSSPATTPGQGPADEDAYTTILITLDQYPEARAAVLKALRRQMGEPEEPEGGP